MIWSDKEDTFFFIKYLYFQKSSLKYISIDCMRDNMFTSYLF